MIGLVLPGNIWFSPYLNIYTKVLDEKGIEYTIISWNRDGNDPKIGHQFEIKAGGGGKKVLIPYLKYIRYIKNTIKENKIDKLIIFGPQIGILLSLYLSRKFKGRYIFDYRDLSIEQKSLCKWPFKILLKNAFAIFVSSPGFIKCLPQGFKYNLSHNFNIDFVRNAVESMDINSLTYPTEILTIGGIRDYSSNIEVVKALANKSDFHLSFVGKGSASKLIEDFSNLNKIHNISFVGYYDKKDEPNYIIKSTFLNIFYPRRLSHDTALSNRFYNSLIFNKPMIVTKNTTQGDYCEMYNLGLSLENCVGLDKKISDFIMNFDPLEFSKNSKTLLKEFINDYNQFEKILNIFVK